MTAKIEKTLFQISTSTQFAFAARIAERVLLELEHVCPNEIVKYPAFRQAVNLLWRQAITQDVDYENEAKIAHNAVAEHIPESEDGPWSDIAIYHGARAVALGMSAMYQPENSLRFINRAGEAMVSIVRSVYEDAKGMKKAEENWQEQASQLLMTHSSQPITRNMFDSIIEYERGAISEEYLNGEEW